MYQIHPNGIKSLLSALNPNKTTGHDNRSFSKRVTPRVNTSSNFDFPGLTTSGPSTNNLERCIYHTTIQEKGDRSKPSNYRPVSLTLICCKIMEHIIHSTVMKHLDMHDILVNAQYGFRKFRSCESQLIVTVQDLADSLNRNEQVDGILLDFSKAFAHLVKKKWRKMSKQRKK